MTQEDRQKMLAEKMRHLQLRRCPCGRMDCQKDHARCIQCGKSNNLDAIAGRCDVDGKIFKRHAYDF